MNNREEKLIRLIEMMRDGASPEDILTMMRDDGLEAITTLTPEQEQEWKRMHDEAARLEVAGQKLSAESDLWWANLKASNIGLLNREQLSIRGNIIYGTKDELHQERRKS